MVGGDPSRAKKRPGCTHDLSEIDDRSNARLLGPVRAITMVNRSFIYILAPACAATGEALFKFASLEICAERSPKRARETTLYYVDQILARTT